MFRLRGLLQLLGTFLRVRVRTAGLARLRQSNHVSITVLRVCIHSRHANGRASGSNSKKVPPH